MRPGPDTSTSLPSLTISGVVSEHTTSGHHPIAGVVLNVLSEDLFSTTTSDADGRYTAQVRGGWVSIAPAQTQAYMSPCPSGTIWLSINPNRTINVDVVSRAVLSTTGVPDSYPRSAISASGTIIEKTTDGPRPVASALVSFGSEPYNSTTLSDSLGRYVLCTVPLGSGTDQLIPLSISKDGYFTTGRSVFGGWDEGAVTELIRSR